MASQTKILKKDRLNDAVTLSLRDIIMKDLLTKSEMGEYCDANKNFDKLNIYIDFYEYAAKVLFNLSINGEPASEQAVEYEMYLVSGNNNEAGIKPFKIEGVVENTSPDTLVAFKMPIEGTGPDHDLPRIYSKHRNGYSYANYALYAVISGQLDPEPEEKDSRERLLMCKGKIFRTDILFDMTESILDGQ